MQSASHTIQQRGYKSLELSIRGTMSHTQTQTHRNILNIFVHLPQGVFGNWLIFPILLSKCLGEESNVYLMASLSCKVAARMDNLLSISVCLAAKEYPYSKWSHSWSIYVLSSGKHTCTHSHAAVAYVFRWMTVSACVCDYHAAVTFIGRNTKHPF